MLAGVKEVIIGMAHDSIFGPMLIFGLGGVYVEILKDFRFVIDPVNESEAREIITGIKTYPPLAGAMGTKPFDIGVLVYVIPRVSSLACDFTEIEEFEISPLMVIEKGIGVLAVDMRLVLKREL